MHGTVLLWIAYDWQSLEAKRDSWMGNFKRRPSWIPLSEHDATFPLLWLLVVAGFYQAINSLWRRRWSQAAMVLFAVCVVFVSGDNLRAYSSQDPYVSPPEFAGMFAAACLVLFIVTAFAEGFSARHRRKLALRAQKS